MESEAFKRNVTLWLGVFVAIIFYYVVHEGTHFILAVITNNFEAIRFVGIFGIEIMIKEVPQGVSLAFFSGLSSVVTITLGYVLVLFMPKILMLKSTFVKVAFYYIIITLLLLDPLYLSILYRFFGGGDMNGITSGLGISNFTVNIVFAAFTVLNLFLVLKMVHPSFKRHFIAKKGN